MTESKHAEQATSRLRNGTHTEVARAAVEATLALAYEQRTANLIAWFGDGGQGLPFDIKLHAQIAERLDLA